MQANILLFTSSLLTQKGFLNKKCYLDGPVIEKTNPKRSLKTWKVKM